MKNWLVPLLYKLQQLQCTSKFAIAIYYVIQTVFGLSLIVIDNIGQQKIHPEVTKPIAKWIYLDQLIQFQYLILISLAFLILIVSHVILLVFILKTQREIIFINWIFHGFTIVIESGYLGIILIQTKFCKKAIQNNSIELFLINSISILYVLMLKIYSTQFLISYSFKRNNYFSKLYKRKSTLFVVSKIIIIIILTLFSEQLSLLRQISSLILTLLFIGRLNSLVWQYEYHNQFMWKMKSFFSSLQFSICFFLFLQLIAKVQIITQNFGIVTSILTFFMFFAIISLRKHKYNEITFFKTSELKTQQNAIILLNILYDFSLPSKTNEQILAIVALLKYHSLNCKTVGCYCKVKQSQKSYLPTTIFNSFIAEKINQIQQQFHKSLTIKLLISFFKLQIFQNYPNLIQFVKNRGQNDNRISFREQISKYALDQQINQLINQKITKDQVISINQIFQLEQLIEKTNEKIRRSAAIKSQKFNYLSKKLCRISEIQSYCDEQLQLMASIKNSYEQNISKFKRSKQFNSIFYFYFQNVFFIKSMVSEINKSLTLSALKLTEIVDSKSFAKFIFTSQACIFESSINSENIGKIMNISKNVTSCFGYSKKYLINQRIQKIFPQQIREQHQKITSNWTKSGRWDHIGKLKKAYLINKNGNLCQVFLYLKVFYSIEKISVLASVIKKNDKDCLIFNKQNQITHIGSTIQKNLCLQLKVKTPGQFVFPEMSKIIKSATQQTKHITTTAISRERANQNLIGQQQNHNLQLKVEKEPSLHLEENPEFHTKSNVFNVQIIYSLFSFGKRSNLTFEITNFQRQKKDLQYKNSTRKKNSLNQSVDEYEDDQRTYLLKKCQDKQNIVPPTNHGNSSVGSLSKNDSSDFNRIIFNYLQSFLKPENINYKRLNTITIFMVIIIAFLLVLVIGSYYLYSLGLISISQIMFADGAVSDNMQLSQFIYNNLMVLQHKKKIGSSPEQIQSLIASNLLIQNYLYDLIALDMEYLYKNVTHLGKNPYYQYLKQDQTWFFPQATKKAHIDTNQFEQFFVYSSIMGIQYPQQQLKKSLQRISDNFPQMKRVNHLNLLIYYQIAIQNISILQSVYLSEVILFGVITLFMTVILFRFFYFKHYQKIQFFESFKIMNEKRFGHLQKYYNGVVQYLQIINNVQKQIPAQDFQFELPQINLNKYSTLNIVNNKKIIFLIWIVLLFIGLNSQNLENNTSITKFFDLSKDLMTSVNNLMDSENYLLEAYFDLKAYFLIDNKGMELQPFMDSLEIYTRQQQVLFNNIILQSLKVYKKYLNFQKKEYIYVFFQDICEIAKNTMSQFQYNKCQKQLIYKMGQYGVITSMTFFQRQAMDAIYQLKQQAANTPNMTQYFNQSTFHDLDQSIIYMFKIYQLSQQKILVSLDSAIQGQLQYRLVFIVLQCLAILGLGITWILSIPYQKRKLGQIYGYLLTFPIKILTENKHILWHTEKVLQIRY